MISYYDLDLCPESTLHKYIPARLGFEDFAHSLSCLRLQIDKVNDACCMPVRWEQLRMEQPMEDGMVVPFSLETFSQNKSDSCNIRKGSR